MKDGNKQDAVHYDDDVINFNFKAIVLPLYLGWRKLLTAMVVCAILLVIAVQSRSVYISNGIVQRPVFNVAGYQNYLGLLADVDRFAEYVQYNHLEKTPGLDILRGILGNTDSLLKAVTPVFIPTKRETKELLINEGKTITDRSFVGLQLTIAGKEATEAQRLVAILGDFLRDRLMYTGIAQSAIANCTTKRNALNTMRLETIDKDVVAHQNLARIAYLEDTMREVPDSELIANFMDFFSPLRRTTRTHSGGSSVALSTQGGAGGATFTDAGQQQIAVMPSPAVAAAPVAPATAPPVTPATEAGHVASAEALAPNGSPLETPNINADFSAVPRALPSSTGNEFSQPTMVFQPNASNEFTAPVGQLLALKEANRELELANEKREYAIIDADYSAKAYCQIAQVVKESSSGQKALDTMNGLPEQLFKDADLAANPGIERAKLNLEHQREIWRNQYVDEFRFLSGPTTPENPTQKIGTLLAAALGGFIGLFLGAIALWMRAWWRANITASDLKDDRA